MRKDEIKILQEELEQFKSEKNEIRNIIGSIGGKALDKQNRIMNIFFIVIIAALFILDVMRHFLGVDLPLPPLMSITIGLLMVSLKIIWMIDKQMKVEHFQFWILNTIEYRINGISKKLTRIEKIVAKQQADQSNKAEEIK